MNTAFRILKKIILYTASIVLLLSIAGYIYLYVIPKPPNITETIPLNDTKDSFVMYAFKQSERKSIKVWTYKAQNWKNGDQIIFVMHGGGRNADDYLNTWVEIAKEKKLLIVAPEFENKFYKYITNDYQEGNLFTFFGTKNPKEKWAYTVVENIFDHIKTVNNITNEHYDIFGHSAGGQFVHRMVMLMPESRIGTAISANSGFYSLPFEDLEFPYGFKSTGMDFRSDLEKAYKKRLVILLGELDNDPNLGTIRKTDLAMEQGVHRLERGTNFYNLNKELISKNNWTFNWEMDTIKNVGHDYTKMSESAIEWIIDQP